MNCEGIKGCLLPKTVEETWIIGYGNWQRQDDGIGPYVIGCLRPLLKNQEKIRTWVCTQLDLGLVDKLKTAQVIIFVDATIDTLRQGWRCEKVGAEFEEMPYLTHSVKPSILLGFLNSVYNRSPLVYSVAVQGKDFGFGEVLTQEAEQRAKRVASEIILYLEGKKCR